MSAVLQKRSMTSFPGLDELSSLEMDQRKTSALRQRKVAQYVNKPASYIIDDMITHIDRISNGPNYCWTCDLGRHLCGGCGEDVTHGQTACTPCETRIHAEAYEEALNVFNGLTRELRSLTDQSISA